VIHNSGHFGPIYHSGPLPWGIAGAGDGATAVAVIACAAGGEVKDFQLHDAGNGVGVGEAVDVMTSLMEDKDGGQLHTPTPVSTTCFNFTIQQVRAVQRATRKPVSTLSS